MIVNNKYDSNNNNNDNNDNQYSRNNNHNHNPKCLRSGLVEVRDATRLLRLDSWYDTMHTISYVRISIYMICIYT